MEKSKLRERVATAVLMKLLNKIDPWEVGVVDMDQYELRVQDRVEHTADMAVRMADELIKRLQDPVKNDTWTIFDAVDGDVLVADGQHPFIYNGRFDERSIGAHGGVNVAGDFTATIGHGMGWTYMTNNTRLATEEECRYLIGKMRQAGYEWDGINRELKKEDKE